MNPFSKNPTPSIFNENLVSKQDKIPQNNILFEFVVREAFNELLLDGTGIKKDDKDIADKLFKIIRERYVQSVKAQGPCQVSLEAGQTRFLEVMLDLCEGGEFQMVRKKLSKAISHFAKVYSDNRSQIFSPSSQGIMKNDDFMHGGSQQTSQMASIEEHSTYNPTVSNNPPLEPEQRLKVPRIILSPMNNPPVHTQMRQSPRITDYIDYLSGSVEEKKRSPRSQIDASSRLMFSGAGRDPKSRMG